MKTIYIVVAAIAVVVVGVIVASALVAMLYYEKSTFISGSGGPRFVGESLAHPDHMKPAKPVHVADEVARAAVAKAGASGRLLGTYLYNATHYVTLVDEGPLSAYAVIWNNETAVAVRLNFAKCVERSFNKTVGEYGEYKFMRGWRYVGYVETSGNLPFSVYEFYDEAWGMWRSPAGYYKVAAAGWFRVVYEAAVYVTNASYSQVTDPMLCSCYFNSYTQSSYTYVNGTSLAIPLARLSATGRAITAGCSAPVFDIIADIAYTYTLNRYDSVYENIRAWK